MKGSKIRYTAEQLAWIEGNCELPRSDLHAKFCKKFGRCDVTVDNIKSLCTRKRWRTGRDGCFQKGCTPPNKGKKMPYNANSAATQFKKGTRQGIAAKIYKPIGSERISKEGYLERKIHDGLPFYTRWRMVHLINWEAINGPIPKGMCLKCIDTDRSNVDPSNWELISRSMLPRLNGRWTTGYSQASPELRPTIMTMAKIEQKVRDFEKAAK